MKKNELKVYYTSPDGVNEKLDKAIEKALAPFGFKMWASGMEIESMIRDLAFDKK